LIKLIKRSGLPLSNGPGVDVKPVNLDQVHASPSTVSPDQTDTDDPISRAQRKADIIVRTAQAEAESIREAAYADGYKAGTADAAQAADELIRRLESTIAEVIAQRNTLISDVEPQMLKLTVQIVEKVIRHEVRTDPRVVERAVKACLRHVRDSNEVCVRVSPDELEQVKALREELLASAYGAKTLQVVADRRVSAGGCVVESDSAALDARVDSQLNRLQDKLMEAFENGRGEADAGPGEIQRDDQEDEHDQR